MAKEFNLETEGRLRYKILTNFVNAYKDKMFLSNSPGKAGSGDDDNVMTLEELKKKTQVEQSDIKLDFEQFMRIFSFEKNRPGGAGESQPKEQSFMSGVSREAVANQNFISPPNLRTPSQGRNMSSSISKRQLTSAGG